MDERDPPRSPADDGRLRAMLVDQVQAALIVNDLAGTVLDWNRHAESLYGWSRAEILGKNVMTLGIANPEPEVSAEIMRRLHAGERWEGDMVARRKDGATVPVYVSESPLTDAHGRLIAMVGMSVDITVRREAERRIATEHTVTRILSEAGGIADAAPRVLAAVCETLDWPYGALWGVDRESGVIRSLQTWHAPDLSLAPFEEMTRELAFAPGVGLPGRVWSSGDAAWVPDVLQDANFPRAETAAAAGLRAGVCFPIETAREVIGVLEFFDRQLREPDVALLQMMRSIGQQMGQFIERKRTEEDLARRMVELAAVNAELDVSNRRRAEDERAQLLREQEARAAAEDAERRAAFLASASTLLASSLDYRTTLVSVARLAVPTLADWCTIETIEEDGSIERMPLVHQDPDKATLARQLEEAFPPMLTLVHPPDRGARGRYVPALTEANLAAIAQNSTQLELLHTLAPVSAMIVPLTVRGRMIGVLMLVTAESGLHYEPADLALAEDLARRAALAVENARLYREAQDADRRKDHFLAMLGHELRNPLGAISAAIGALEERSPSGEPLAQQRAIIGRQVRHLTRLVDDMLDVSRISSGKITLRREPVDLNDVARRSLDSLRTVIEARGHRTTLSPASEPVVVEGDAVRLEQVVCNLLDNAAKYTPAGGHIDVAVETDGDDALIRVTDSGVGIPPETLPTIFELFTQVPGSLDRAQGGLGLGLALVRGLVERQGGSVTAHSAGLGRGSSFVVRLPRVAGVAVPASAPKDAGPGRPLRVLLVEDNVDGREALRALLEAWGHHVCVAEDGGRGIALARTSRPEVALIDIGLPDVDGYQVARAMRGEPTNAFLVALTGYGQAEDRQRALQAGFDAHLVKPLDPDVLVRLLAEVAGSAQDRSASSRKGSSVA